MVKTSADSLLTVINDILDFSKIEAGKLELDCVAFDLRECLDETMKALWSSRAEQKIWSWFASIRSGVPERDSAIPRGCAR